MNFNETPDYSDVNAYKINGQSSALGTEGLYPHWVADMDFTADESIIESLKKIVEKGLFVYNTIPEDFIPTIINWLDTKQGWRVEREWVTPVPGIVKGLSYALHHFTSPGDKIIIQSPVYHPFRLLALNNGRGVTYNPIITNLPERGSLGAEKHYDMNLDHLRSLKKGEHKLLILCNPHNPIGKRWKRETLQELAEICYEKEIIVISDEIHADLSLWGERHTPFASVSEKAREISVTFGAPSKTFNIPGLFSSYIITPNASLRDGFYRWLSVNEYSSPTIFATTATIAAYTKGEKWRDEVLKVIENNILFMEDYLSLYIPEIRAVRPQASFLVWLDCRDLKLSQTKLMELFMRAGLAVNSGTLFGEEGEGYVRFNIATPQQRLKESLDSLCESVALKKREE